VLLPENQLGEKRKGKKELIEGLVLILKQVLRRKKEMQPARRKK